MTRPVPHSISSSVLDAALISADTASHHLAKRLRNLEPGTWVQTMLGWLFPRSPIDAVEKAWIETHMLWLAGQFGVSRLLDAQVVPASQVVTDRYNGTPEDVRDILARLCEPLAMVTDQYQLDIVAPQCGSGQSGLEQDIPHNSIRIGDDRLVNPYSVAATVARELAWRQLPTDQLTGPAVQKKAWLADLAAVYLGWGAIVAHIMAGDVMSAQGCGCGPGQPANVLPSRMLGYALALFAHVRGETRPLWKDSLQLETSAVCRRSLSYLRRTGDTLFGCESAGLEPGSRPVGELLSQLKTGSRSARVAALWELRDPSHAAAAAEAVAKCLHDRFPAIREEAAHTLAEYGAAANQALPSLIDLLQDSHYSIRAAAARALGKLGANSSEALEQLAPLLRDPERRVVHNAAVAIKNFGQQGAEAMPILLAALRAAMIRCDHELIDTLTDTLFALDPDPTDRLMAYFADDPELREQVVHVVVDALGQD